MVCLLIISLLPRVCFFNFNTIVLLSANGIPIRKFFFSFPSRAAGAGRALLGASTTHIRGYCQKVSSTAELDRSFRRTCIMFGAGAVTACNILYCTFHTKLNEVREQ
ncbi:hypothetical protein H5410_024780 [Solanum commersonii]|uniref:Uncharacterized protein n=1 Tax=Solanum commersonii TaxID=4109 RepID=A0A9J5ZMZ1_SOLCO|nr:hypothetical protein H5410_024780 [Solanum commersonii]